MGHSMLSFAHPIYLWLLPFGLLFGVWWFRRAKPALRYSQLALLDGLPRGRAVLAEWVAAVGRSLVLGLLILSAAGPRWPDLQTRLPVDGIAIALVCDVSGSMATPDFTWESTAPSISRLDAAKRSFLLFVDGGTAPDGTKFDGRPADAIALVTFAAWPQTECPLTLNHTVLAAIFDAQKPRDGLDAGTNVGDAIAEGVLRLEGATNGRRVMILISDGEHNAAKSDVLKPRQSAQLAANLGIPIYTIDCGGEPKAGETTDDAKQRQKGRAVLRAVAERTGGQHFTANGGADLLSVYRAIDAIERQPIVSYQYRRYRELYPWCAAAALGCLVLLQLLEGIAWRRLPR